MDKTLRFIKENKTFLIVMTLYTIITFLRVIFHQPWFDEAHAWTIADELNLAQIFELMKVEGHTFIWYLLLMPFAKTNFHYPYPMLILNWLFCWGAVFIFWRKAPFNNVIKTLLTFSYPFIALYAVVARCYAIGIFFLFALAALYKKQLARPYLFASLIALAANTSVIALIGAVAFGLLFAFNIIKSFTEKCTDLKTVVISFSISAFGAILVLMQLLGASGSHVAGIAPKVQGITLEFFSKAFIYPEIVNYVLLGTAVILFSAALLKGKQALFFSVFSIGGLLTVFHTTYIGYEWHHYYFLVYAIISLWLLFDCAKQDFVLKKAAVIMLGIILASYCIENRYNPLLYNNDSKYLSQFILNDENLKTGRLILVNEVDLRILPYLKNSGTEIYSYCLSERASYKTDKYESDFCGSGDLIGITVEGVEKSMSNTRTNYLVQVVNAKSGNLGTENGYIIESGSSRAIFSPYKKFGQNLYFYKVTVDKKQ